MNITLEPIGVVHNDRRDLADDHWGDVESTIELDARLPGSSLDGIEGFSHAEIIYHFHRVPADAVVTGARHPRDNPAWPRVGILAQRAKARPNRLGSCIARVVRRAPRGLVVVGLDAIDGTPVVDIKPVIAEFLPREPVRQPEWATELMRHYWHAI